MSVKKTQGRRLSLSVLLGMALIPVAAVVAVAVVNPQTEAEGTPEPLVALTTTSTAASEAMLIVEPISASSDDLADACGQDGLELVQLEQDKAISDVQQAALDALRLLCEEKGMPLPGPAAPPPIVTTKVIEVATPASPTTSMVESDAQYEDHEDHEDHEDEEDEEDEHEEDHEDEKDEKDEKEDR